MKRSLTIALSALILLGTAAKAAYAENIGTVDYDKLVRSYQKAQAFNDDSKIKEQELEKMQAEFVKQIREAKNAQPNNPVAIEQLQKTLQQKLDTQTNQTRDWMEAKYKELDNDMDTAIQSTAHSKGLDVVLAKPAVLVGGTDITNDVLNKLNASAAATSSSTTTTTTTKH